jgi:Zn-dependent protease with chaperone function
MVHVAPENPRPSVTDDQFASLVARLAVDAARDPVGYRRRVVLLALVGYAYIGLALIVLVGLVVSLFVLFTHAALLAMKLIAPAIALVWIALRALWVRNSPPVGREITAGEAPALFQAIEELRQALNAAPLHHVLMIEAVNAGFVQQPRFGVFGPRTNYLLIGLPLMRALTVEQFRALLAHEYGHLAAGDARIGNWIYRLRATWYRLMSELDWRRLFGTALFRQFFDWYAPYFNAYSFPLARAQEYAADRVSARLTSPRMAAEALTGIAVSASYIEERFWPDIQKLADDAPTPPVPPHAVMPERMREAVRGDAAAAWLEAALGRKAGIADTHPSFSERLAALGEPAHFAPPSAGQAADTLLGNSLEQVTANLDQRWLDAVSEFWEADHAAVQDARARLARFEQRLVQDGVLEVTDAYERATLTERVGAGPEAAFELFRDVQARAPNNPVYAFALGERLLQRNDEAGCALIERAIDADEDSIVDGCVALRSYFARNSRPDEERVWEKRLLARVDVMNGAGAERRVAYTSDHFDPHGLPDDELAVLRTRLGGIPNLRRVYLVRKRVRYMPERPLYVLGFSVTPWWMLENRRMREAAHASVTQAADQLGSMIITSVDGASQQFEQVFKKVRHARIL